MAARACVAAVGLFLSSAGAALAAGATLYVANNGMDTLSCGAEDAPCRSITRAIAHASAGDQIVVGPGMYGDVNRDGVVDPSGDSGEEAPVSIPELACSLVPNANLALIRVDKPLTIVSRDGAGATVIEAGGQFYENYVMVDVTADDVVFGKRGKGFTVRNGNTGVHVAGNVAGTRIEGNVLECFMGLLSGDCTVPPVMSIGTVVKGNTSQPDSIIGFYVLDASAVVSGNVAKGSFMTGFAVFGGPDTSVTKNLAIDGLGNGMIVVASDGAVVSRNAAIGNNDSGLMLVGSGDALAEVEVTIEKNSFFGNGKRPLYPPSNCGITVQNSGAQMLTVSAAGNWWGDAGGPGIDPADSAGGTCSAGTVTLNLGEPATKEIRVKPPK